MTVSLFFISLALTFKLSSGAKWVSVALDETYITERKQDRGGNEGIIRSRVKSGIHSQCKGQNEFYGEVNRQEI